MALSARQKSKVIKMLGPFCAFCQHRSKTVRKRRRNHGYKINAKSFFCTALGDTTALNWMTVHFEGNFATALPSYSNRRGANQNNA